MKTNVIKLDVKDYNELITFREQIKAGKYVSIWNQGDFIDRYYYQEKEDIERILKVKNKELVVINKKIRDELIDLKILLRKEIKRKGFKKYMKKWY